MEISHHYKEEMAHLLCSLQKLLSKETQYQTTLEHMLQCYTQSSTDVITPEIRNKSIQNLRVLNRFYGYPSETFMIAVNVMDRFLSILKVRPRHMACITVSCYHIAIKSTVTDQDMPSAFDLIRISQSKCTVSDLNRMQRIILEKLEWDLDCPTSLTFLHLFHAIAIASEFLHIDVGEEDEHLEKLCWKLEACMCQTSFTVYKASTLALCLLSCELAARSDVTDITSKKWMRSTLALQLLTEITDCELLQCRTHVSEFLVLYGSPRMRIPRSKLTWVISSRTARQLQFSAQCVTGLPTIHEHQVFADSSAGEDSCNSSVDDSSASSSPPPPPPYRPFHTHGVEDEDFPCTEVVSTSEDGLEVNNFCVDRSLIFEFKTENPLHCQLHNIYTSASNKTVSNAS
ncbi:cyclin-G2-like [Saccoglossus kowalevskii]